MSLIKPRGKYAGRDIIDQQRKHLEPDEVKAFFHTVREDTFWYPYFYVQYFFGCRMSEPALLLKEDWSEDGKEIIIRRLKKRKEEGGYVEMVYGTTEGLREALETVLDWSVLHFQKDNPFMFPSTRTPRKMPKERAALLRRIGDHSAVSRQSVHCAFKEIAGVAGIPERLRKTHVMRHTRATLLLAAGKSPEAVKHLLGHTNIETTKAYIHVARDLQLRYQTETHLDIGFSDVG